MTASNPIASLLSRIRGGIEAAPWVIAELAAISRDMDAAAMKPSRRHVGDSHFEEWFSDYHATLSDKPKGTKQIARDAYAAGMDDPDVVVCPKCLTIFDARANQLDDYKSDPATDALRHAITSTPESVALPERGVTVPFDARPRAHLMPAPTPLVEEWFMMGHPAWLGGLPIHPYVAQLSPLAHAVECMRRHPHADAWLMRRLVGARVDFRGDDLARLLRAPE